MDQITCMDKIIKLGQNLSIDPTHLRFKSIELKKKYILIMTK